MGVQNDNNFEGSVFERSLNFHNENKNIDDQIKPLPESKGEWERYIDNEILPSINNDNVTKPTKVERPTKTEYYLKIAECVASRSTCLRRKFGAIIVKDDVIVSTGYSGAPRGRKNCCDRGICFRMENNIPSGQRYELCRSVHAEMNAIINADPIKRKHAEMYLVGIENDGSYTEADCCSMCKRMILNSGINNVTFRTKNGDWRTVSILKWINEDDSLTIHEGY